MGDSTSNNSAQVSTKMAIALLAADDTVFGGGGGGGAGAATFTDAYSHLR